METISDINTNLKTEEAWDHFSFAYYTSLNYNSLSLMCTLISLTRVNKKYKILDAGCGPGLGTKLISTMMPNNNSIIYAFDFSKEMLNLACKVFTEFDDFNQNKKNYWEICSITNVSKINLENDLQNIRKTKIGKIIKLYKGKIENLPFENEQFDVYISNLCLMLTDEKEKAINEAFRVLNYNGIAAFSVWGKSQFSKILWEIFTSVFAKHNLDISDDMEKSFWLGEDESINSLKDSFYNAGFKDIRMEQTYEIYDCYDEQDFLVKFQGPKINSILRKIKDDIKVKEILEDVKIEANRILVKEKKIPTLNVLIIIAFK